MKGSHGSPRRDSKQLKWVADRLSPRVPLYHTENQGEDYGNAAEKKQDKHNLSRLIVQDL